MNRPNITQKKKTTVRINAVFPLEKMDYSVASLYLT